MQRAPASSAPMRMYRTGLPVLASRWGSTSSVGAASAALLPAGFFCFSSSSGRAAFSRSASRNASSRCCCFSSSSRRACSSSCCSSEGSSVRTPLLPGSFQSPHRLSSRSGPAGGSGSLAAGSLTVSWAGGSGRRASPQWGGHRVLLCQNPSHLPSPAPRALRRTAVPR